MGDAGNPHVREGQNVAIVHQQLRDEILLGHISAGVMSQVALARQFGIGRTPLREALRLLEREGLVIAEPNRRVRIAGLSAEDAEELYMMRVALESSAVRLTVPTLGSAGIAELEGLIAQMEHYMRGYDTAGLRAPHQAFHARLVAEAGPRGASAIALLFDHAERYRVAFGGPTPEMWEQRSAEHRAIVDAAAEGDAALAAHRLVEHYVRTAALIFEGLDPSFDPQRLRVAVRGVAPGAEAGLGG